MPSYLNILYQYGKSLTPVYEHSVSNAVRLADGKLPLVVVMQEPCNLADEVQYESMLYGNGDTNEYSQERIGCPALQEVEKLVEEGSGGKYKLKDISLFYLNTLLSPDIQEELNDQGRLELTTLAAHEVFWRMILAKCPKVVVVLTCSAGTSKVNTVRLLWSSLSAAGSVERKTLHKKSGDHDVTIIRGFHPSVYLRDDYTSEASWSRDETATANDMLRLCFARAFSQLTGKNESNIQNETSSKWRYQVELRRSRNRLLEMTSKWSLG